MNEKDRTEKDYQILFNVLYKFEKDYGLLTIDEVDLKKNCEMLLMLSKSQMLSERFCPRAYKCVRVLGLKSRDYPIARIGKNLHYVDDVFWKDLKKRPKFFEDLDTRRDLRNFMFNRYMKYIPEKHHNDTFILQMANNFIDFEINRIMDIYNELGKNREVIERYIMPVALELGIENWSRYLVGYIDRIDRMTNDALCVIDYKYGKPKDYYSTEQTYDKTAINIELGFYGILPQGKEVYVLKNKKRKGDYLVPIEEAFDFKMEFYYGSMLFFQDPNTLIKFVIDQHIITNSYKAINRYWEKLNSGDFKPKTRSWCWDSPKGCVFYENNCEIHPAWKGLDNAVLLEGYNYESEQNRLEMELAELNDLSGDEWL
jgi:hypothetical protein